MDRCPLLCPLFKEPFLPFFWIPVCCFFPYLPSDPLAMLLRIRKPGCCLCSLSGHLWRISAGDLYFSSCEGFLETDDAKGKNAHFPIYSNHHRCIGKSCRALDKFELGALLDRNHMGYHSPFLFSCGFDGLFPSKKKVSKFPLGILSSTFSALRNCANL